MITQTTNWFHKHFGLTQPCAEYDNTSGKFAAEFCGRVPTHFAHNQKDWTGKDITVKGEGEEQTEENANAYRRARNKSTATKARVATATLDKAMATKTWEPPGA